MRSKLGFRARPGPQAAAWRASQVSHSHVIEPRLTMHCRDDALQTRTNEVTDALRRTTQTMQAELERSVLSVQMLGESEHVPAALPRLYLHLGRADEHGM